MRAHHTNQGQAQPVHRHHGNPLRNREGPVKKGTTKNLRGPGSSFKKLKVIFLIQKLEAA